jgi:hypothetical protein
MLSGQPYAYVMPGVATNPPTGFVVSNLDPNLISPYNNEIFDPNFIPGFSVSLPNTSIDWRSGNGYAKIGYSIGPWSRVEFSIPHLAMGPQCCNFVEVPHTQQFRLPSWGDYYYVRAGLGPPGVNIENFTATFGGITSYVGLRTDWNWTARISLNWTTPVLFNPSNEWAAIGIAVTQVVPNAPDKLVYTLVNFWMDQNSSRSLHQFRDGILRSVSEVKLVTYHPIQLSGEGNKTITIQLSPYLSDTLHALNLSVDAPQPPVIAYVYLNVEGYNFRWNTTVWSYYLLTPSPEGQVSALAYTYLPAAVGAGAGAVVLFYWLHGRKRNLVQGG